MARPGIAGLRFAAAASLLAAATIPAAAQDISVSSAKARASPSACFSWSHNPRECGDHHQDRWR